MTPEGYVRRTAGIDEFEKVARLLFDAFGEDAPEDYIELERLVFEPDRSDIIVHGGEIVANVGAYTRDLTVPGAVVPAAHVTFVGVSPLHRRRGLLTRLIGHQLRAVRAGRHEPLAVLWASEGRIYQRYGYGMACRNLPMEIDAREVRLDAAPASSGTLRGATPADVRKELEQVYERVRADRPGYSSRDDRWWEFLLGDPESRRNGATRKRALLYEDEHGAAGYAIWRTNPNWRDRGPNGEVHVLELVAATAEAYAALWRFLLAVDLTRTAVARFAAADEPLQYLVNEPRQLNTRVTDGLWLRVVDVPAALAARRYAAPVDVVLSVTDGLLPENAGNWRLRADASGVATCTPTGDEPDLACDVADLGAAYLGGTSLDTLARGGRVKELRAGALAPAATAFGWHRGPAAVEIF